MKKSSALLGLLLLLSGWTTQAHVSLSVLFQSNMVLQRDKPCSIRGRADSGENITLQIRDQTHKTTAGPDGKWLLVLPPHAAGGPYTISISGSNTIVLNNILFGDVWICSGQSNMQMLVRETGFHPDSVKDENAQLRLFTADVSTDFVPQDTLRGGRWYLAGRQAISTFSATGYFFGNFLQHSLHVPVGLICSTLGTTTIETWMSPGAIQQLPQFEHYYDVNLAPGKSFSALDESFQKVKRDWERDYYLKDDPGLEHQWYRPSTDTSEWKEMNLPCYWEDQGLPDYDGSVWFRRNFDVPANYDHIGAWISLGQVDDYNIVWVNGHKVGEMYGNQTFCNYFLPDSLLRPSGNVIVVRAFDAGGKGGIYNLAWRTELAGRWIYRPGRKVDAQNFPRAVMVNANMYRSPSVLYNGSIAPLTSLSVKGFLWYQGESNTERAEEYAQLFPALIKDWRKEFQQGDLPFLFVQLSNFGAVPARPAPSEWAELREAQSTALSLPNTAMVTTIDLNDAGHLHSKNKPPVGKRLCIAALRMVYSMRTEDVSPVYDHMQASGDSIFIYFKEPSHGLANHNKQGRIRGFAIAGTDKVFHWATAQITDHSVIVYSKMVKNPVAVRYAWSDNPGAMDLFNTSGWPVAPFRTDDWSLQTAGRRFEWKE